MITRSSLDELIRTLHERGCDDLADTLTELVGKELDNGYTAPAMTVECPVCGEMFDVVADLKNTIQCPVCGADFDIL